MPIPFALAALIATAAPDVRANAVVAAERGFAADAARYGTRLAFLAHFDADSWLFRPYPTPALAALARDPDDGSPLEWSPDTVGVSASGDFAFTSGPWSAHAAGMAGGIHGHFLSIWKRGDDGVWRVEVDGGISHPPIAAPADVSMIYTGASGASTPDADELARRRHALEATDDALRRLRAGSGDGAALADRFAAAHWRALRRGHLPADDADARALAGADAAHIGSGPRRALDLAASGDLAYTIGGDPGCTGCGKDYRIWRWQNGEWRLIVDLELR